MKTNQYYLNRVEARYKLNINFWKAFMNFFGFYPNLYENAINNIANKTTRQALMSDVLAIHKDNVKIIQDNELLDIEI